MYVLEIAWEGDYRKIITGPTDKLKELYEDHSNKVRKIRDDLDNLYENKNLELRSLALTVDVNTKTKDLYEQREACIKKYKEKESLLVRSYELFEYDIDLIEAISLEELQNTDNIGKLLKNI